MRFGFSIADIQGTVSSQQAVALVSLKHFTAKVENPDVQYFVHLFDRQVYDEVNSGTVIHEMNRRRFISFAEDKLAAVIVSERKQPSFTVFDPKSPLHMDIYTQDYGMHNASLIELLLFESLLPFFDAFMLHSSVISYNDKTVLFSAPSGTGKSTQAELWEKYEGAHVVNGDRAVIRNQRGTWCAYGSPWAGTSKIFNNEGAPVSGLMIVRQAPVNRVTPMPAAAAARAIISEAMMPYWSRQRLIAALGLIEKFVINVPVYLLECRPDEEAVKVVKNILF